MKSKEEIIETKLWSSVKEKTLRKIRKNIGIK